MHTIKGAAELTGISIATLRAWERRYGVVTPERTDAGYRVYDTEAVHDLGVMQSLVREGWTPMLAAAETKRRRVATKATQARRGDQPHKPGQPHQPGQAEQPEPVEPIMRAIDSDDPTVTSQPAGAFADLIDAAARLDAQRTDEILDEHFAMTSFEVVADSWLLPALAALGEAWAEGRVSVAGEHLVAHCVQRRLATAYESAASRSRGPRVVIGLPPGARHDLGLLAFATAARRSGLTTVYVGADLPIDDWSLAVKTHGAVGAVVSAPREADVSPMQAVVQALRAANPALLIAVGGSQQAHAPRGCLRLGHDIGPAAATLADVLYGDGPEAA